MLCIATQEEEGQWSKVSNDATQSGAEKTNAAYAHKGGASVGKVEKAGHVTDSIYVHSVQPRILYENKEEKCWFLPDSFKLNKNKILIADSELKDAVIKLFVDNFEVLATHSSQYGGTEVLQMKIDLVPGLILYKSQVRLLNPDQRTTWRSR